MNEGYDAQQRLIYFSWGSFYEGDYRDGMMNGIGRFMHLDGSYF